MSSVESSGSTSPVRGRSDFFFFGFWVLGFWDVCLTETTTEVVVATSSWVHTCANIYHWFDWSRYLYAQNAIYASSGESRNLGAVKVRFKKNERRGKSKESPLDFFL